MENVKYEKIATDFEEKYREFYKGNSIDEEITQSFWHSLMLYRKRSEKLKVNQDVKIIENGTLGPAEPGVTRNVEEVRANGRKSTVIETPVSIRRRYYKNGKKLAEKIDYTSEATCLILEKDREGADTEQREIVCPTCGGIGTRESLFDGCDYCGRKFQVDNEERKVSAFAVFHDAIAGTNQELKKNKMLLIIAFLLFALCVGVSSQGFILRDTPLTGVALSKIATLLGCIVLSNGAILLIARHLAKKNKMERMEKTPALSELQSKCPDFHFAKLTEDLEYKLKSIHFAESQKDIEMFANELVAKGLLRYENVLDCQMKNCKITGYNEDEGYHHITVNVTVVLTILQNNRIAEKEENVDLSLYKSKKAVLSKSLVSYSCDSCGNSVNLLNGGICECCGQRLKLENYDWVIDTYTSNGMKKKDGFKFYLKLASLCVTVFMILLNITNIRVAAVAAQRSLGDMYASAYMFGNEMIPSLENYGYALLQSSSKKIDNGVEYSYSFVDGSKHVMVDYPQKLVDENGFEVVQSDDGYVKLERNKEFSKGKVYVEIKKNVGSGYTVSITK